MSSLALKKQGCYIKGLWYNCITNYEMRKQSGCVFRTTLYFYISMCTHACISCKKGVSNQDLKICDGFKTKYIIKCVSYQLVSIFLILLVTAVS